MQQKLVPDLFIILVNNPKQPLHARTYFKSKIFRKSIIKKPFKKGNFLFFRAQSLSIDKIITKQRGPGTSDQWLFRLNSFVSYVLSDQVWCNIKLFLSYPKNYICKFTQANLCHHKLFHVDLHFWIWKVWKGREKITKSWISRQRKELFRWNKKHFSKFLKAYHLMKK